MHHSFYFVISFCLDEIWLPPLMSENEYIRVFQLLYIPFTYDKLLQQLLNFFNNRSPHALVEFAVFFLNEQFLPDLVGITISQTVYRSHGIISRVVNTMGCTYERVYLPLITIVNCALTQQLAVAEETFLSKCLGYSNTENRYVVIGRFMQNYLLV